MFRFISMVMGFSMFITNAYAQATAAATATANVVTPISITKNADMNFGNVAVQNTIAGTVVLTPASTRTRTGGVTLPATTGTVTAASFTVTGTGAYTYSISLPGSAFITHSSGSPTLFVGSFTSTPSGTGTLTGGTQTFTVGATLSVSAGAPAGIYTSTNPFNVTVNYN